ncbi:hypothetical protein EYF80_033219 [Liparis tanakae]|uniref:Uncharacterized protein n=1 Tax=Liparis tanakae TaxID=230148 RepID=A0A4Z2GVD4_9TELE|nr:hypothetical protein EYF80_033219 [Liparis tanakae]
MKAATRHMGRPQATMTPSQPATARIMPRISKPAEYIVRAGDEEGAEQDSRSRLCGIEGPSVVGHLSERQSQPLPVRSGRASNGMPTLVTWAPSGLFPRLLESFQPLLNTLHCATGPRWRNAMEELDGGTRWRNSVEELCGGTRWGNSRISFTFWQFTKH